MGLQSLSSQGVWDLNDLTQNLKELEFSITFPISFQSGGEEEGSKRFIMVNSEEGSEMETDVFHAGKSLEKQLTLLELMSTA